MESRKSFDYGLVIVMGFLAALRFGGMAMKDWFPLWNGWTAGIVGAVFWDRFMAIRKTVAPGAFVGKRNGDVAYIGSMMVFFSAWGQANGLLAGIILMILSFFCFIDSELVLPDESLLLERLMNDEKKMTVEVDDPTEAQQWNCTRPMRLKGYEDKLMEYHKDCGPKVLTVRELMDRSKLLFSDNYLCATREVISNADGTYEYGKYIPSTYGDFFQKVEACQARLGGKKKLKKIGIFSKNCEEFAVSMFAALHSGIIVVPLYASLGPNAVRHIVNHAELSTVFCSEENLETVLRLKGTPSYDENNKEAICHCLEKVYVFLDRSMPVDAEDHVNRGPRSVLGIDLEPFENLTATLNQEERAIQQNVIQEPVEKDDLAFILYTSGTTGNPKGVMLTHGNVMSSSAALCTTVVVRENDVHLSYLPLAHAFEIAVILAGMSRGASVGWFHGNVKELTADAATLKPTLFIGVPRVYSRVQQVILQQFALKPTPIKRLCYHAVRMQIMNVRKTGKRLWWWDLIVFRQVKAALGGRVRIMCTGSAPLASTVHEFVKVCFDVPMVVGYGSTEVSATSHVMFGGIDGKFDDSIGSTGPPLASCESKLESVPDLGYTVDDDEGPRGEVLVRGPGVFKGYYKDPELTRKTLTSTGWLRMGDIGRINPNGSLSIIGRARNVFKLAQGEFVAPEHLETQLLSDVAAVGQIFVYGNSFMSHLVAIVVPDPLELLPRLKRGAIPSIPVGKLPVLSPDLDTWLNPFDELCSGEEFGPLIKAYILSEITKACKAAEFPKFMWVKDIMLITKLNNMLQGFSVENNMLTPTFKQKRSVIEKKYAKELKELSERSPEGPIPSTAYPPSTTPRQRGASLQQ